MSRIRCEECNEWTNDDGTRYPPYNQRTDDFCNCCALRNARVQSPGFEKSLENFFEELDLRRRICAVAYFFDTGRMIDPTEFSNRYDYFWFRYGDPSRN